MIYLHLQDQSLLNALEDEFGAELPSGMVATIVDAYNIADRDSLNVETHSNHSSGSNPNLANDIILLAILPFWDVLQWAMGHNHASIFPAASGYLLLDREQV